ncbi:aldehyde ferredoxin oxidoreductase C-terminal domain-containing protein [Sulfurisoma sediminicola]|uniref:Aldehyde:ferredoxin oxidoreductase n=1 Tax=Sulfurisoma sediminicola TaxID=1381557 RepID=A0A497XES0_9PROT|nr:aldehyde ferredoxin oxidoreductase C-terminal domain-containing protein [Sulfurisoma sediminicola]RLJ65176.1 aldehyde:ferredoxin oxidoreductase [Sulfurisoma sediminicola]
MGSLKQNELRIDLHPFGYAVHDIAPDAGILGPVDHGWYAYKEDRGVFTFGEGMLATSPIHGARRLVFCGYSPLWETFYISSMGGAAFAFKHVGVNYVRLAGRAERPSILLLNNDGDGPRARLEPIDDFEAIWQGYKAPDGSELLGVFALQQALFDRWGGEYPAKRVRSFVVGPVSAVTPEGTIGSNPVEKGGLNPVADWCGRGGMGSRLLQQHNIVGCIFGGNWEEPHKTTIKDFDPYFVEHFGDRAVKIDKAVTAKYALDPKTGTGGTFGSNYHSMGSKILSFNYRSMYAPKAERLKQHQSFIVDHYLRQFNEETIAHKKFEHCGEPCSVACKKMNGKYKKDYEPYHTLGPQVGVFDQRAAELLNDHADALGFDAIQIGGMLAWIMECVADRLIEPADFGFPPREALRFERFTAERGEFELVGDSMLNARYAMALIDAILADPRAAAFRGGIRAAARELNRQHPDTRPGERAVYLASGTDGCMVPNQYFVPGMGSPMPLMGKYYVFYGPNVLPPEEVGRRNVERMVYELVSDNLGMCRFHRQWTEPLAGEITRGHFGLDTDLKAHHFELARQINALETGKAVPWETERMADMLTNYMRWLVEDGATLEPLNDWLDHDKLEHALVPSTHEGPMGRPDDLAHVAEVKEAALVFWHAIKQGQEHAFAAGPDSIATLMTPARERAHVPENP